MKNVFNIFRKKKRFYFEPFIYINQDGNIIKNSIGSRVKWLEKFTIDAYSQKSADKIAYEEIKEKYPEYIGHIWFF
jgi:hypothetical protein